MMQIVRKSRELRDRTILRTTWMLGMVTSCGSQRAVMFGFGEVGVLAEINKVDLH